MRSNRWLGFLGMLLAFATYAWADVVELKTGQRIEGTLKEANAERVSLEVGGQSITFKTDQVRAVYFGSAPPAASSQAPSPAKEALNALKGIQSVVGGGIAYRDYAPRVSDAKIVVDRYLGEQAAPREDALRTAIAQAMGFYVLASSAWNVKVSGGRNPSRETYQAIGSNPLMRECTFAQQEIEKQQRGGDPAIAGLVMVYDGFPALWQCAREKIAEADKLILAR